MRTLAVVPIKSFATAKQRLAGVLAGGARQALVQAMFSDVLGGLRRTEGIDFIAVVTDDITAESLASGPGMVVLHDDRRDGQSEATEIGIRYAEAEGYERVLLVPGDTPLLDPVEIEALLARCSDDGIQVAIVPDRHGTGTNALLIQPAGAFEPAFGPDSLPRHLGRARGMGLAHRIENVNSLAYDVDTADDLVALWNLIDDSKRGAQRTRGTLSQLDRAGARAAVFGGRPRGGLTVEA